MQASKDAIQLLQELISRPSLSGDEKATADLIENWMLSKGISAQREQNNVWARNLHFNPALATILLNSHHDTVKANSAYTRDPFDPAIEGDQLFGLGSNDAGGPLVSLLQVFAHFYDRDDLNYNLIIAATAEEENSGPKGLNSLLSHLGTIDFAIVGEPTEMKMAIAEKGLLVIDGQAQGIAGHAAHENTLNAIYEAMADIEWIKSYQFPLKSDFLGPVKMSVTQIQAGSQHNVVPSSCDFVIDVRINEHYSPESAFEIIDQNTRSRLKPRSFRNNSSSIALEHPLVQAGLKLGIEYYGSPTLSDQAVLSCPSLKMGPGKSTRSHQANEYILLSEIEEAIKIYIQLLESILK